MSKIDIDTHLLQCRFRTKSVVVRDESGMDTRQEEDGTGTFRRDER